MEFDRQSVTVVTGNVRRVVAHHRARLDDEVFQNLVHRRAEMDVGVRVRWTIVKDKLLAAFARARGSGGKDRASSTSSDARVRFAQDWPSAKSRSLAD